jgi:hypothetical protein
LSNFLKNCADADNEKSVSNIKTNNFFMDAKI